MAPAVIMGCNPSGAEKEPESDPVVEKVKNAMLTMQRASWEQGVAAQSLLEAGDYETVILMAKESVLRQQEDGRLSVVYTDNGVTDPAASGVAVLFAADRLGDPELKKAADRMLEYLMTTSHKTEEGILHHTLNAPEIWIDAMYMAPPFLARAGEYEESIRQIEGFRKVLWNPGYKLYSHRWDAQKKVFINEKFWGVGNGWALAGITRVITYLPASYSKEKELLTGYLKEHLDSCLGYMRDDGLYHDIMNDPGSFVETNLGQMIAYTIYSGIAEGWLDTNYLGSADKMRDAARDMVDEFGFVQGVCGAPYFNSPGSAAEGQAFFILMEAAHKKLTAKA